MKAMAEEVKNVVETEKGEWIREGGLKISLFEE
jgi:hypothetical protein